MADIEDYLGRITPYWRGKPKFTAEVQALTQTLVDLNNFVGGLPEAFDLDEAIGAQEDAVGIRVGRSRTIPVPIPNPWFSFDDPLRGFDEAPWSGPLDPGVTYSKLDDETYRRLLRAKILANSWDGTTVGAQAALNAYFIATNTFVFVIDNGAAFSPGGGAVETAAPMTMTIGVAGKVPTLVDLQVLEQQLIPVRPEGVALDIEVTSVDNTALFGFDVENQYIAGFDTEAWGVDPSYYTTHPT